MQISKVTTLIALLGGHQYVKALTYDTRFQAVKWDDDNWRLTSTSIYQGRYQGRMSLSNGYLGINLASVGPFFEVDTPIYGDNIGGWPLFNRRQTFATIAGFYDSQDRTNGTNYPWLYQHGGESVISGVPHWGGLMVKAGESVLNASVDTTTISNFSSTLDLASGTITWDFYWAPKGGHPIHLEYLAFVHKLYVNQAVVQLKLTSTGDQNVSVVDILEGECAVRSDFVEKSFETETPSIWSAVRPNGINNVTAYIYSTLKASKGVDLSKRTEYETDLRGNQSTIAQQIPISLCAGNTVQIEKYIGGASTDAFQDPQATAKSSSLDGAKKGLTELLQSHVKEWHDIFPKDSVDNYYTPNGSLPDDKNIEELQITAVTNPFHVLQNTVGRNAIIVANNNTRLDVHSIPVCGLGSDCYAGMIFWDAEVWMAPGLQVSHPYAMKQLVRYRDDKYSQAKENVKMASSSSQNATGKFSEGGAAYPWTSGRYGNCTGTGPCFDYEYHLNGDIGVAMYNYYAATGDAAYFKETLLPIYNSIAYFFGELMTYNETSGLYALLNATDPDEYANNVDNAGFTSALIQRHLNETNSLNSWFGLPVNDTWTNISSKMRLPVNEEADIILEYATMNGSISVKQADVVLIDDIIHYENSYTLSDLDYYAAKQSMNGPGMTYGVFSIVANEISPSGCSSYTYDLYSSQPYARAPWFQFSEQLLDNYDANGGTHPAFPFLTGMGGANRVALFGYLGLRLFVDRLDVDPSLPPQIPYLNYRTFYWQGHAIRAHSNSTHTTLSRLNSSMALPNANSTYDNNPIPVTLGTRNNTYSLGSEPIQIPNRLIGQTKTVANNLLQCRPKLYSNTVYLPGQFPQSAIDGAISTKWQPAYANETAWLSVEIGTGGYTPVTEVLFDWGVTPPTSYQVIFTNSSLPPFTSDIVNVTSSANVTINRPYDPSRASVIEKYIGNQTNITLNSPVWSGRFAHLGIKGNGGDSNHDAAGATVAEWSLVGGGGTFIINKSTYKETTGKSFSGI